MQYFPDFPVMVIQFASIIIIIMIIIIIIIMWTNK